MDTAENEQLPNVQRLLGQPLLAFNCLKMIIYLDWLTLLTNGQILVT